MSRECSLALINPAIIDDAWNRVEPFVREACDASHGRYASEHIYSWAKDREWQLWLVIDRESILSVAGTQIVDYPTGLKCLAVRFCIGSERERWQHFLEDILQWGRAQGCTHGEGTFRRGWSRVLKGWDHTHEHLERAL